MWEVNNFDALFEEPSKATSTQISIIEGLLIHAAIDEKEKEEIDRCLERMDEKEAYETINYLKEKQVEQNPVKQFNNYFKNYE